MPPTVCSQSSSVKPSPSSANAARRSSRTAEISASVRSPRGPGGSRRPVRPWPRGYLIGREARHPRFPPIGWPVSGTFGRYLSGGAPAHPPYPTRRTIPDCRSLSMRGFFGMARTHLTPSLRRLAMFLVAIALVAAISPGLAVAANGPPKPVDDAITTAENEPTSGNVLDNDSNLGEGDLTVTGFVALAPTIGTITSTPTATTSSPPPSTGTARQARPIPSPTGTRAGRQHPDHGHADQRCTSGRRRHGHGRRGHGDRHHGRAAGERHRSRWRHARCRASRTRAAERRARRRHVTFTPAANDCGTDAASFDYDISDGNGGSDSASVTVDVTCLNERRSRSTTRPRAPRTRR